MNLLDALRKKDKKGLFEADCVGDSYPTGFLPFDYRNGYVMSSYENNKLVKQQSIIGIPGGGFMTVVGKSGTSKTTAVIQWIMEAMKPFDQSFAIHFDLEQATSYTRVLNVTGESSDFIKEKYIIKQGKTYIQEIFNTIMEIVKMKEELGEEAKYDTGKVDEFNKPVRLYQPTFIFIDSIPSLASDEDEKKEDEMQGGTYANRMAKAISQFYTRLMPVIKPYNITVIAINHIKAKIEINPMTKQQPQLLYMKMDESMPGGVAPVYYAHLLLKFIAIGSNKYTMEKDGFDGNDIEVFFLKSRTNKAGQSCTMVYNQVTGFDKHLTLLKFANMNDLIEGKNPYLRFKGSETKFSRANFGTLFESDENFRKEVMTALGPSLNNLLSRPGDRKDSKANNLVDILNFLEKTQELEAFEE